MGGKSGTTKQTTENKPPAWAEPMFKKSAAEGNRLYDSGVGGNTYMGSTVAPLSDTTMQGVNQLRNAGANWDISGTRGVYGQIGAESVNDPYERSLADTISGKYLEEGNPYYRARLESDLTDTAAQVRSLASGSGRYGSDVSNRMLTDRLGYQRNQALENDFNRERGYQMQGIGMASQMRNAGLDRALTSTNAMRDIDQQNFLNRMAGSEATLKAGNILDQQSQAQLADEVAKFYALDNQDWNRLAMLQSAATGAAGNYGVQNQTTRAPMGVGGVLGGLGGLFQGLGAMGKSDITAKENIVAVGRENGLTIYEFSYKGEKSRWRGVMAQEIPLYRADAIYIDPADGKLGVRYDRLGLRMERVA